MSGASVERCLIHDEREVWHAAIADAARSHGFAPLRIFTGHRVDPGPGVGFIRPHADWRRLPANRADFARMRDAGLTMVQDAAQIDVYEDKSEQFRRWSEWMPETWRFTNLDEASEFLRSSAPYPLVSKADVGASSTNVRILWNMAEAARHVEQVLIRGIPVHHGAQCPQTLQRTYVLLQRFIPHKITWRVNAIGGARAVFQRYCYPDRPVAQTGNVEPATRMTGELESLLAYADRVFAAIGSKWCALDILREGTEWRLLETSLAWPWPSPGECNSGPIFRSGGRKWIEIFEVLFDEIRRGAWDSTASSTPSAPAVAG